MPKLLQSGPIITGIMSGLEEKLSFAEKRSYPANYTLLQAGGEIECLYYVVSGEVLVSNYASPESISRLFIMREKSMLGLIGMFNPNKSMATWRTLTPCVCYLFSRHDIYARAPREMLLSMLEQMAAMSSSMTRRFAQGNIKHLEVRVARLFIHMLDACERAPARAGEALTIAPKITQALASELLSMHPVTLNRILAALREQGIIGRFTKNRLEILDLDALKQYADGEMPPLEY